MHDKVLPRRSRTLLARLEALSSPEVEGWTLAGGTGLALQVGHRVSEDFDFFKVEPFAGDRLYGDLSKAAAVETLQREGGTLTVLPGGIKVSFFSVPDRSCSRARVTRSSRWPT